MAYKTKPTFSKSVDDILCVFQEAKEDHAWNLANVKTMEQLTQDYLHKLELEDLDYKERAKLATKLSVCRKNRRASKDTVEVLEPLIQFLDSEKGKQLTNLLNEVKGKTRKAEERMQTRIYFNRVLNEKPIRD